MKICSAIIQQTKEDEDTGAGAGVGDAGEQGQKDKVPTQREKNGKPLRSRKIQRGKERMPCKRDRRGKGDGKRRGGEQRAAEDEMQDNDRSFCGSFNLSCCYWEENGIEELQQGSEGEDRGPEVGMLRHEGAIPTNCKCDKSTRTVTSCLQMGDMAENIVF